MLTKQVTIQEAQEQMSALVSLVQDGQEVFVVDGDTKLARLSPVTHEDNEFFNFQSMRFAEVELPFP